MPKIKKTWVEIIRLAEIKVKKSCKNSTVKAEILGTCGTKLRNSKGWGCPHKCNNSDPRGTIEFRNRMLYCQHISKHQDHNTSIKSTISKDTNGSLIYKFKEIWLDMPELIAYCQSWTTVHPRCCPATTFALDLWWNNLRWNNHYTSSRMFLTQLNSKSVMSIPHWSIQYTFSPNLTCLVPFEIFHDNNIMFYWFFKYTVHIWLSHNILYIWLSPQSRGRGLLMCNQILSVKAGFLFLQKINQSKINK